MSELKELKKILLIGLDNSGKTSIVLSLKGDTNLLSFLSLKPTRGLKVEQLDTSQYELNIWDFGGQEQYREDYLNSFYKYTESINKVIFVIDVQNIDRYDLAMEYFKNIIILLARDRVLVDISVFLHKYDPNLKRKEEFKNIDEVVQSRLVDKIVGIIPLDFKYEIYKTSIYTVFEKDLIKKSP
jgi:small GTP-binding protein